MSSQIDTYSGPVSFKKKSFPILYFDFYLMNVHDQGCSRAWMKVDSIHSPFYEMICYVHFIYVCDLESHVHTLLMVCTHFFFRNTPTYMM